MVDLIACMVKIKIGFVILQISFISAGEISLHELYIQPICDFIGAENGVLPQVCIPREGLACKAL